MSSPTPSRRGLIAASAWTVPAVVLASSAPAFAASGTIPPSCVPTEYLFNWASSAWTAPGGVAASVGTGVARGVISPAGTPPIAMKVTRQLFGGMESHANADTGTNMQISPGNVGATNARGLTMYQRHAAGSQGQGSAAGQTLTFNFPGQPVKGLSFSITDIDGQAGQFHDRVSLSITPAQVTHASRVESVWSWNSWSYVDQTVATTQGAGTAASPFTSVARDAVDNTTSDDGNVQVKFSSAVAINSFSITFWNGVTGSLSAQGQQAIHLSNLRFIADVC